MIEPVPTSPTSYIVEVDDDTIISDNNHNNDNYEVKCNDADLGPSNSNTNDTNHDNSSNDNNEVKCNDTDGSPSSSNKNDTNHNSNIIGNKKNKDLIDNQPPARPVTKEEPISRSSSSYAVQIDSTNNKNKSSMAEIDSIETWSSSINKFAVTTEIENLQASFTVSNQKNRIFPQPTIHVRIPRSTFVRETLPDFDGDSETSLAFLLALFGSVLCQPLLCLNWYFVNSPNKRARNIARCSICLSVPFFLFLLTSLLPLFNSLLSSIPGDGSEIIGDMIEGVTNERTCQSANSFCCAGKGSLLRYVDMCADAGIVDPTGKMCRYNLNPCEWINRTIGNTTDVHCHGIQMAKKTICHKHRAPHITGREPGEL